MKRLTCRNEYGEASIVGIDNNELYGCRMADERNAIIAAIERLEQYEDMYMPTVPASICVWAIKMFGEDAQTDMVIEEMAELTKALLKLRRKRRSGIGYDEPELVDVAEETADVLIMLVQLLRIYGSDFAELVEVNVDEKIKRLKKRLIKAGPAPSKPAEIKSVEVQKK